MFSRPTINLNKIHLLKIFNQLFPGITLTQSITNREAWQASEQYPPCSQTSGLYKSHNWFVLKALTHEPRDGKSRAREVTSLSTLHLPIHKWHRIPSGRSGALRASGPSGCEGDYSSQDCKRLHQLGRALTMSFPLGQKCWWPIGL